MSDKDTIYRQQAIDAIEYELEMINSALDSITLDFNTRERLQQRIGEAREILNSIQQLPSAQPEQCSDCIANGGDWECDHIHCHIGQLPSAQIKYTRYEESILTMLFRIAKLIIDLQGGCMKIFDGQYFVDNNDLFNLAEKLGINY